MSDEKSKLVGANGEKLILSPDEAKERIESKAKRRFNSPNKYNISRDEALSLAVQVGQEVYDQLRAEHAIVMAELQKDLKQHFGEIKNIVALNILDLQRRSFSYRLRRDFEWDCIVTVNWLRYRWEHLKLAFRADWESIIAWLEFYGIYAPPKQTPVVPIKIDPTVPPDELHFRDKEGNTTGKIVNIGRGEHEEPQHVGAPTELPSDPGIARVLVLDAGRDTVATD